ncbi:hypothetical protein, partial [Streptomyces yangpuensis]
AGASWCGRSPPSLVSSANSWTCRPSGFGLVLDQVVRVGGAGLALGLRPGRALRVSGFGLVLGQVVRAGGTGLALGLRPGRALRVSGLGFGSVRVGLRPRRVFRVSGFGFGLTVRAHSVLQS